ncbi:MAG: T9SS type A sorting domain-containing protein [Ignavibacteria bacterium]|nr:T9SS type A sorting domain-containing protein [Ignavibacteria bacterium]
MTVFKSIQFLIIAAALISGIFSSPIKAQINAPFTSANNQTNFYSSDQPFASYWFPLEILSWSPSTDPDAPYNRSGVLLINKYVDSITVVNPNARVNEARVNPLSAFAPTSDNPSQGTLNINYYTFSFWQYVDQLVFWGGSAGEGLILAPNPTLVDAAHRNGVKILGNVFFPPIVYGGQFQWVNDFLQKSGNTFPVADKLIEVAEYYGFDGWFLNQETVGGNSQTAVNMRDFMIYFQENSNLEIEWYDSMTESGAISWQNQLNSQNDWYFQWGDTLVSETMFLNFWWSSAGLNNSRTLAQSLNRNEYELFAGIDVEANGYNTSVNWSAPFPNGLPHVTSLGIYRPDWCYNSSSDLANYYNRSSIFWVGWNNDPSNTTTSNSWKGFANYIPAFTTVTEVPFVTNFCTGQGYDFYINGEQLSYPELSTTGWNNLSLQDVLPTWRWIVQRSGTKLTTEFDFTDAYYGGNSLKISGDLTSDNLIKLYKANCLVSSDTKIDIAFKTGSVGPTNMKVGLAFENDPSTFIYFDVGNATTSDWNLKTLAISAYNGQKISVVALFFTGGFGNGYEMKVGRLSIYNGTIDIPNPPTNLFVENKVDEPGFVTLRLRWDHSTSEVYYYNVFRRNQDNSLTYLGGTANNAYFVPFVKYEPGDSTVSILVQTLGNEFGESSFAETSFEWFSPPGIATNPSPENGDTILVRNPTLGWTPGNGTTSNDVYLGTTNPPPFAANVTSNTFQTGLLSSNTTYYWRIDCKNQYYTTVGEVWGFTTGTSIADTGGYALQFDGTDDLLNCGNGNSLQITGNKITLEAWINVNEFKSQPFAGSVIVKDQGSNSSGYMIRCGGNGIINFNIGNGSWHEINSPANSIQLNSWQHVATTYDGTSMKIYIDGELKVQLNISGLTIGNAVNSNLLVGESPGFPGRVFNGKIDEVRIWNGARTQSQIQSTMNTILTPEYYSTQDSGLVGYWRMDEGVGQTAEDLSFFSNTATLGASANPDASDPTWVEANILVLNVAGKNNSSSVPEQFSLSQNYPNPFNPSTRINYSVPYKYYVKIKLYDILGNEIATLVNEEKPAGNNSINFDASGLSSGVYFYQLSADNFIETKKMILLR